jgi:hypothetical protein
MVSRPYECPLCQSAFRSESGMKWHLVHRHETPAAFDALAKDYQAKDAKLVEDNGLLKKTADQLEAELDQVKLALLQEQAAASKKDALIIKQQEEMWDLGLACSLQKYILKNRFNTDVPLPLLQKQP